MSDPFNKILFFADGAKSELAALRRCYDLAIHCGASLTVIGVIDTVATNDIRLRTSIRRIQKTMSDERGAELDQLISSIDQVDHARASVKKIVAHGKDYLEVIKAIKKGNFDLLVKAANSEGVKATLFGSRDTKFLHYCPCPVLALKPSRRKRWQNILGAVDPRGQSPADISLNKHILRLGASLAGQSKAAFHLLHVLEKALPDVKLSIKDEMAELERSLKEDAERKMNKFQEGQRDIKIHEHLLKGRPAGVIAKFVKTNDIDLLIMGSVARSGASGLLVGNTAEKIMDEVDCSLLVLKPEGWQTPVQ